MMQNKAFKNFQHSLMMKALIKIGAEGNFLSLKKIYKNLEKLKKKSNSYLPVVREGLSSEKETVYLPLRSGSRRGAHFIAPFPHHTGSPNYCKNKK